MLTKPAWAIVGNKMDLVKLDELDVSLVTELARTQGVLLSFTSAKDSTNVQSVFLNLVKKHAERPSMA